MDLPSSPLLYEDNKELRIVNYRPEIAQINTNKYSKVSDPITELLHSAYVYNVPIPAVVASRIRPISDQIDQLSPKKIHTKLPKTQDRICEDYIKEGKAKEKEDLISRTQDFWKESNRTIFEKDKPSVPSRTSININSSKLEVMGSRSVLTGSRISGSRSAAMKRVDKLTVNDKMQKLRKLARLNLTDSQPGGAKINIKEEQREICYVFCAK